MRYLWKAVAVALALVAVPLAALAQSFPTKTIRILIPFPPGGPTDQLARVLAQKVSDSVGQPIIVDNRPGGGAQIAASLLKQAPADGYTLLIGDLGAFVVNPSLYANLSYDPTTDFQPITTLLSTPMVLLVPPGSKARSLPELLSLAKTEKLNYGSQGPGTGGHLMGHVLNGLAGGRLTHVPYKGAAPAMQDLLSGQVDVLFEVVPPVVGHAKSGSLKALALAGDTRSPQLPDVPTSNEAGSPELKMNVWFGLVTRAGTPADVVQKLHTEFSAALSSPDVAKRFKEIGFDVIPSTPTQFAALLKTETQRWAPVVKATGVKVD